MNTFHEIVVKDDYEIVGLIRDPRAYTNRYHAVIHRVSVDDYVYCYCYDITDGTWGQGYYFGSFDEAVKEMGRHI